MKITKPIKIMLVDDHKIVLTGLKSMLEDVDDIKIVAEASNGKEALKILESNHDINVVLMDIKMPELNGIETTKIITAEYPDVKVMVLTMYEDEDYIISMLQAGAMGYILKNTGKQELVLAIHKLYEKEHYFSQSVTASVMSRYLAKNSNSTSRHGGNFDQVELTDREIEILKLIAHELTNQEIADKLIISPRTVHSHRRNLMQKIGVKNTAGLVKYAVQQGLL